MRTTRGAGFTMIELMMVVAVIAILALIALPSLQSRLVRQNIAEAIKLADIAKGPIATAWSTTKTLPPDNASIGLPVPEKVVNNNVKSVAVENGAIHITFGNSANGALRDKVLTLRPAVIDDAPVVPVSWVCGNAKGPDKMTIKGTNRTDVAANLLPLNCR